MVDTDDWATHGEAVGEGSHRIPLPMPYRGLRATNVYALESNDELVLIDAGWAMESYERALESGLNRLGRSLADVTRFLVTHVHRDHYPQAVVVRRRFGTRVCLGFGEQPTLRKLSEPGTDWFGPHLSLLRANGAQVLIPLLRREFGPMVVDPDEWESPDEWLFHDQIIAVGGRRVRVIHTPGHTQGHVVFVDSEAGMLFAGDHVLPEITPSIGFESVLGALPLGDYLRSLARVRRLPDLRLLPAHGPIAPSVHARVDELIEHHSQRLAESRMAMSGKVLTAYDVAQQLLWTGSRRPFRALRPFDQMLAVNETGAHLDLLVARADAKMRVDNDGLRLYSEPDCG